MAENSNEPPKPAANDQFARLFVQHQRVLFGYLVNQLGNVADAEEVLQETSVVLLREWEQFEPGTNFIAWACRVALNQVHHFRRERKKSATQLDSDLLDRIASEGSQRSLVAEQRRDALQLCLEKLSPSDRQMLSAIYGESGTIAQAAEELGRPRNTLYKGVQRIRRTLMDCITHAIQAEERS